MVLEIIYANISVRLSVTHVLCVKTAECIIEILSLSDRHHSSFSSLSVVAQIWRLHPNGGAKYKGGANFQPICGYISEMVIDRGIVTMEDEYKVVCALSNSAAFDDLEWPRTPVSRSQYMFKGEYLANGASDPLHVCSSLGFSGSADQIVLFPVR